MLYVLTLSSAIMCKMLQYSVVSEKGSAAFCAQEHPKDQRNKRKDKTLPAPPEPIKSTKKEKREEESRVVKPKVKLEKRCAAEEASTEAGSSTALAKEDPSASQKADDLATPGNSNVAFDELGGEFFLLLCSTSALGLLYFSLYSKFT